MKSLTLCINVDDCLDWMLFDDCFTVCITYVTSLEQQNDECVPGRNKIVHVNTIDGSTGKINDFLIEITPISFIKFI